MMGRREGRERIKGYNKVNFVSGFRTHKLKIQENTGRVALARVDGRRRRRFEEREKEIEETHQFCLIIPVACDDIRGKRIIIRAPAC